MLHARAELTEFRTLTPDVSEVVSALGQLAAKSGIEKPLLELIKLRASQINGCAFCVQYHILQAEDLGVAADKLNLVVVWREAPLFTPRERAALAWTEALTLVASGVRRRGLCGSLSRILETGIVLSEFGDRLDQRLEQAGRRLSLDTPGAKQDGRGDRSVTISFRCLP